MEYYFSTPGATGLVKIDSQRVVTGGAPIFKTWIGQPFSDMLKWYWNQYEEKPFGQPPETIILKRLD